MRKPEEIHKDPPKIPPRPRAGREEMDLILRALDTPVIAREPSGALIFANESAARLLGFPSSQALVEASPEAIGRRFDIHDESGRLLEPPRLQGGWLGGLESGAALRYRDRQTGKEFWAAAKSIPALDGFGGTRLIVTAFAEAAPSKRADLDLARSRDELQVILRTVSSAVFAVDPTDRFVFANEAAARMFGFAEAAEMARVPRREVMERYEILDDRGNPIPQDRLATARALSGEAFVEAVTAYRLKANGEVRWSLSRSSPVFDSEGRVRYAITTFTDITDLKNAEAALALRNQELGAILKTMDSALTAQDARGNLVHANEAAARLLGFSSAAELLSAGGRAAADKFEVLDAQGGPFPPDKLPGRRALQGESVSGQVIGYRVKATGEERWSLVNATPVHDDLGNVRMAVNVFNDITPIMSAEKRRREAEEAQRKHLRYLEAVDSVARALERAQDHDRDLPVALDRVLEALDADRIWLIHPADPEAAEHRAPFSAFRAAGERPEAGRGSGAVPAGMPVRELLRDAAGPSAGRGVEDPIAYGPLAVAGSAALRDPGRPLPEAPFWRDAFEGDKLLTAAMRPQVGRPWICLLLRGVGRRPWAEEDVSLFKDIASRLSAALGAMILYRDMRRSEENYRTLFERSLDGIYRCGPDGTVLDANPALIGMLGYPDRSALVGTVQKQLLPAGGAVAGLPDRSEAFPVELKRADGGSLWAEVNSQAIRRADGGVAHFEGMVRNINDRKRTEDALKASEEKLRQSQKMEAVGRLAGGVAHDFNNLLTAINGFSDLLLMTVPPEDARRGHVEEIRKAGERAASLTGQLLAFSRKQVLSPRLLDLNAVVTGMQTMLRRLIGENIDFKINSVPDLGKVMADPGQVEQIILNLALNARDAMPAGGELVLSTGKVRLEHDGPQTIIEVPAGDYLELAVRDTGSGMDAETKARLFEPFFTTKPKDKGTGLGLSMVYGAVKQMNGTLAMESEPGVGTAFRVYLPAAPPGAEAAEASRRPKKPAAAPLRGSETILLVEDEDAVRRLVRDVLEANGYKVLDAPGGEKALEMASRHQGDIHLLLTDVVMGGMSGRELAEKLLEVRPTTKVLYMSGYTEDAIIRHGVMAAHTAFIGKPFTPAALAGKVREVLGVTAAG